MHVPSDGFMNEVEAEQEALMNYVPDPTEAEECAPEDHADGIDVEMNVDMLALEHDEIANPDELEKSGDLPTLPSTQRHAPRCPEVTKKGLIRRTIMYDWDSGWETGEIVGVSGRGRDRLCCVEFGQDTGKHSVVLGSSNYCQVDAYERGRWFQLINKDESELGEYEFMDAILEYGGRDEEGNEL
jgi:hypothetical protein